MTRAPRASELRDVEIDMGRSGEIVQGFASDLEV